ncbi:hypothetical protein [Clostridium estertheticum]|uniref:hypothetical protein n=1 Tax=Clostridium estertheticum TaxID=238834 RepID=UPI001CF396C0|nr:hypothetical protein [Clostridium estertheticum]MCB2354362.1 hypothetical protein [Clostridium estertheticum]WAG42519.1 hypothetical protein LL065_07555 [Clostridium estertheticum]
MLKAKMIMLNEEMVVTITENCKWNEMASKLVVLDWVCEGNELPEDTMVECLDSYLYVDSEDESCEIAEIDREIPISTKMETMYLFCLKDYKTFGTATEKEINELIKTENSPLWVRYVAEFDSVLNRSCEGWDVENGFYQTSDGTTVVEDEEIFLIPNITSLRSAS